MRTIVVDSFATVQELQEKYRISFTCSITRWTIEVLNELHSEGVEDVELVFNAEILPESYVNNAAGWRHILKRNNRVDYPHLNVFKRNGEVVVKATLTVFKTTFIERLRDSLQHCKTVRMKWEDIPISYQTNIYVLIHRLRNRYGFSRLAWRREDDLIIFHPNKNRIYAKNRPQPVAV